MILLAHPYVLRDDAKQFERMEAFSNFAALNCVVSLDAFAAGLARLLRSGAPALLVMFGTCCPVAVVQFTRGDAHSAVSRRGRGPVPARLCGRDFTVGYHTSAELRRAMAPWFELRRRLGIGVFVPPSAAESWISEHPSLVRMLDAMDRVAPRALAPLGDHVLYWLERTATPVERGTTAAPS